MTGSALPLLRRLALAFVLSLVVAGILQQGIMLAIGERDTAIAFFILAGIVVLVTAVFAVVAVSGRGAARMNWTAITIVAAMLVLGLAAYAIGIAYLQPGIAGNILYLMALFADFQLLLPAALAVPVHWLLLRAFSAKPHTSADS